MLNRSPGFIQAFSDMYMESEIEILNNHKSFQWFAVSVTTFFDTCWENVTWHFLLLAALEFVIMTTLGAANDEKFINAVLAKNFWPAPMIFVC